MLEQAISEAKRWARDHLYTVNRVEMRQFIWLYDIGTPEMRRYIEKILEECHLTMTLQYILRHNYDMTMKFYDIETSKEEDQDVHDIVWGANQ